MRFEFYLDNNLNSNSICTDNKRIRLHESDNILHFCGGTQNGQINEGRKCGSYGLTSNPNKTTVTPCAITVDVNGDRKPYPVNVNAISNAQNTLVPPAPNSKKIKDVFTIMITEDRAIPYGVVAQRAMYQAQK